MKMMMMMMMMKNPPGLYVIHMLESDGVKRRALRARRLGVRQLFATYLTKYFELYCICNTFIRKWNESFTIDTANQCGLVKQNYRCKLVDKEYPIICLLSIAPCTYTNQYICL